MHSKEKRRKKEKKREKKVNQSVSGDITIILLLYLIFIRHTLLSSKVASTEVSGSTASKCALFFLGTKEMTGPV
jgi:cell division septal protein FtsQ